MAVIHPGAAKLFYEESKDARTQLDELLKQYRSNTTTILALATGAAAFFSFEDSEKGLFYLLAIVSYGIAALVTATIFWPKGWRMNNAHDVYPALTGAQSAALHETKLYLDLGRGHQEAFSANKETITRRLGVANRFRALLLLTALVIIFAGINVNQEAPEVPDEPTRIVIVDEPAP